MRARSTITTITSTVRPRATHSTPVGRPALQHDGDEPDGQQDDFVICDHVPVTSTSEVVSPSVKPEDRSIA